MLRLVQLIWAGEKFEAVFMAKCHTISSLRSWLVSERCLSFTSCREPSRSTSTGTFWSCFLILFPLALKNIFGPSELRAPPEPMKWPLIKALFSLPLCGLFTHSPRKCCGRVWNFAVIKQIRIPQNIISPALGYFWAEKGGILKCNKKIRIPHHQKSSGTSLNPTLWYFWGDKRGYFQKLS